RARVTKATPEPNQVLIEWRRGGEGLGGEVIRGRFTNAEKKTEIEMNTWSAPLPLEGIARKRGWTVPTLVVPGAGLRKGKKTVALKDVVVEFDFAEKGKSIRTITEPSPRGSTVGLAIPLAAPDRATFAAELQGLSGHARARRERLEKLFPGDAPLPKQFGI